MKNYGISLDEFCENLYEIESETGAGHYAVFETKTKDAAVDKFLAAFRPLIEKAIYESDDYGYEKDDEA